MTDWTNVGLLTIVLLFLFWNKGKEGYKCGVDTDGKTQKKCSSGTVKTGKPGTWGCSYPTYAQGTTMCGPPTPAHCIDGQRRLTSVSKKYRAG